MTEAIKAKFLFFCLFLCLIEKCVEFCKLIWKYVNNGLDLIPAVKMAAPPKRGGFHLKIGEPKWKKSIVANWPTPSSQAAAASARTSRSRTRRRFRVDRLI
ncbi:hypothetical protein PSAC2689_240087 [Paraburkholderia sacchari]